MSPNKRWSVAFAVVGLATAGCATQRSFVPTIQEPARAGLVLRTPLRVSILDARSEKEDSPAVIQSLQSGLSSTYGPAFQWVPYFEATPVGAVSVRIRLLACEAKFGSRIVSSVMLAKSSESAAAVAVGPWGSVAAAAASERTLLATGFSAEGWWIGTAWVELEIEDRRSSDGARFSLPLVAEDKESNTWGFASADEASHRAWALTSQGLIRVLDKVTMAIRDSETQQ